MRFSLRVLIVVLLLPRCVSADDQIVGALGAVQKIDFIGASSYAPGDLRDGLSADLDFLASAQPQSPRDEFLTTLAGRVREGYRHQGFPEANASAEVSESGGGVLVRVTEGPRYRCGRVIVRGGRSIDRAAVERAFTEPWFTKEAIPVTTLTAAGVTTCWEYSGGIVATPHPPLWVPGELLPTAGYDLAQYHDRAKGALAAQGFLFSHFRIFLHHAPQALATTLVVEIDNEGPPFVFGGIAVYGPTRDSAEDVTKFLGLKRGQKLDFRIEHEIVHRLWSSGRYYDVQSRVRFPGFPRNSALGISSSGNQAPHWEETAQGAPPKDDLLSRDFSASSVPSPTPDEEPDSSKKKEGEKSTIPSRKTEESDSRPDRPVSVVLELQLADAGGLPGLREELTPSDRGILKFCDWLRHWPGDGEPDLVFAGHMQYWGSVELELFRSQHRSWSIPVPTPDFQCRAEVVLSSGNRQFVRVQNALGKQTAFFDQAAIISPESIDWRLPLQRSRLQLPWDTRRAVVCNLRLMPMDPTKLIHGALPATKVDYRYRGVRMGRPFAPSVPGFNPNLSVDPAIALLYLRSPGVTHSVTDGVLRVAGPNVKLEIEADSGRLLRGQLTGWNGTVAIALWTAHGALAKEVEHLDEQVGSFTDRLNPEDPWASICECLRWEFSPLGEFAAQPMWPAAAAALRIARRCDPQRLLDVLNLTDEVERPFSIPGPDEAFRYSAVAARRGGDVAALFLKFLSGSDDLRALAVDTVLHGARAGRYVPREIPVIARGNSSGPLIRFTALNLIPEKQAEIRRHAALRQKSALTRSAFLEELRQLDELGILTLRDIEPFVEAFGEMGEVECQALAAQFFSPDLATAITRALAPLRRDRTRPVRELLAEVLDRLWSGGLEPEMARRLDDWAPESKVIAADSADAMETAFPIVPATFNQPAMRDDPFPDDIPEMFDDASDDSPLEFPEEPVPVNQP